MGLQDDGKKQTNDRMSTTIALIRPALDVFLTKGTKRQKSSMLQYCSMYYAAFHIGIESFGTEPTATSEEVQETIRKKCMAITGFARFLVMYPRKAKLAHNSTANPERVVGKVRGYYEHMNGRAPGAGRGIDSTRTPREVSMGLRKLYSSASLSRIALLAEDMWEIRSVMRMDNLRDLNFWELSSQWQGVMRSREILRPTDDKAWRWDPSRDTHVGRIIWEDVSPGTGTARRKMIWRLKTSKKDQGGEIASRKPSWMMITEAQSRNTFRYPVCCTKGGKVMIGIISTLPYY